MCLIPACYFELRAFVVVVVTGPSHLLDLQEVIGVYHHLVLLVGLQVLRPDLVNLPVLGGVELCLTFKHSLSHVLSQVWILWDPFIPSSLTISWFF